MEVLRIFVDYSPNQGLRRRGGRGGGAGEPWPLHFFAKNAIPKFVDNRFNSL